MQLQGGALPWSVLTNGFSARGQRYLYASAAEGIFRPAGMTGVLSVKTVVPKPKGRIWYHDQADTTLTFNGDVLWYAFTGREPQRSRNQWLRSAMERALPLIYFFGVASGVYEPLFPAFVVEWNRERLSCGLSFSVPATTGVDLAAPSPPERRYALRIVRQRLHQAIFREQVLACVYRKPHPHLFS